MQERTAGTIPELRACWVGFVSGRPFCFALSPFACMFVSGTLTPAYGHSVIACSDSIWLHRGAFLLTFPSATVPLQGPTALSDKMLCFPWWCSPTSPGCSFISSETYDLNDGKSRVEEGRDNGKRSSRKKETKDQKGLLKPKRRERESPICRFTIISYITWAHGKWISVLCIWPFRFRLYKVLPNGEWRCPVNWESFQRQDVRSSYLAYMNTTRGVSSPLQKRSSPFLLSSSAQLS